MQIPIVAKFVDQHGSRDLWPFVHIDVALNLVLKDSMVVRDDTTGSWVLEQTYKVLPSNQDHLSYTVEDGIDE